MGISDRIKTLRKEYLKISQEEFGRVLGVSRDVIGNIEYDRLRRPEQKEPIIKLICKEFDVNEEWLRDGIEPMKRELTRDEAIVDWAASLVSDEENNMSEDMVFAKKFANMLSQLTVEDWKTLAKMAQLMADDKKDNR